MKPYKVFWEVHKWLDIVLAAILQQHKIEVIPIRTKKCVFVHG